MRTSNPPTPRASSPVRRPTVAMATLVSMLLACPPRGLAAPSDPPPDLPPPAAPSESVPEAPPTSPDPGDQMPGDQAPDDSAPNEPGGADAPIYEPPPGSQPQGVLAPQPQLDDWERSVLMQGPISEGSWILGGVLGTWMGFGLGHLAQGRFNDSGLLFAGGEIGAMVLLFVAIPNATRDTVLCSDNGCTSQQSQSNLWQGIAIGAGVAFVALRVWEIYDVWAGPSVWNDAYRRIRARAGPGPLQFSFAVVPTQGGGSMFGQLRF